MHKLVKLNILPILLTAALLIHGASLAGHVHLQLDAELACLICGSASTDGVSLDLAKFYIPHAAASFDSVAPAALYLTLRPTCQSRAPPLSLVV